MLNDQIALLLIHFNRPDLLEKQLTQLFEISSNWDLDIYVALDGPRSDNVGDHMAREQILVHIDRFRQLGMNIILKAQIKNLGCKNGVECALDWFFDEADWGVVFEDDISFNENTLKYFNNTFKNEVQHLVSGFTPVAADDLWLSQHGTVWGWGGNSIHWKKYRKIKNMNSSICRSLKTSISMKEFLVLLQWVFLSKSNAIDTWDFQWNLYRRQIGLMTIMPPVNLVCNLGFGSGAHHHGEDIPKWLPTEVSDEEFSMRGIQEASFSRQLEGRYFGVKYEDEQYSQLIKGTILAGFSAIKSFLRGV